MKITYRGIRPTDAAGRNGLPNPERGFRFEIGIGMLDDDPVKFDHIRDNWPFPKYKSDGTTIAQAYCYLTQFHSSPISSEKIAALCADFDRARREGVKFLLRFAYEFNGVSEGPTGERILEHIRQLTPIVRDNIDVIYCLQTGWVGLWGEFHTSVHGIEHDPDMVAKIVEATLSMLPESRFTMMRRIAYKEAALKAIGDEQEITTSTAFSPAPHARIGFFNDGTLANWWDGGTFVGEPYAEPGDHDFDRVAREGCFMPVDGELFWTGQLGSSQPFFANALRAIERFSRHHYTTFSLVHGFSELDHSSLPWTIDLWKKTPVTAEFLEAAGIDFDSDYFAGVPFRSGYEFVRDHLGYRLAAVEADFSGVPDAEKEFTASVTLKNFGFSTPINKRGAEIVVLGVDGSAVEIPFDFDCRHLQPLAAGLSGGKTPIYRISATGRLPSHFPTGKCRVAIWFPDADPRLRYRPEYAIRLATALPVEIVGGRLLNILAEF